MPDLTKPPTPEQLEAWPPLTPDDIHDIEDKYGDQLEAVFKGDMVNARRLALLQAHEIATMWPRIVTTAMMLWELQKKSNAVLSGASHD